MSNTHAQADIGWSFYLCDGKLKYCSTGRSAGEFGAHGNQSAFGDSTLRPPTRTDDSVHEIATDESALLGVNRLADGAWSADATLRRAMLDAHAAIAGYLLARIEVARGAPTRRLRLEAPVREEDAQRAILHLVRNLRARGARPEYLLVRFKELLATLPRQDYDVWDAVRQQTIQWVIEEYYRRM